MTQDSTETFTDWLTIHKLDLKELKQLVVKFPLQNQSFCNDPVESKSAYTADEAWDLSAKSLAKFLPDHSKIIQLTKSNAPKCLTPQKDKSSRPYTLDQGTESLPYVSCNYTGSVAGLINIAHEFAHAVQIVVSREYQTEEEAFMPPLARECCAFVGEIALIDYFEKKSTKLYTLLKKAWRNDNLKYLKADAKELTQAIEDNQLVYSYNWNYPIARLYALMLRKQMNNKKIVSQKIMSKLFASGVNATQLVSIQKLIVLLPIPNPLPKMPKPAKGGFTKYQILGAVTSLAISDQQIDVNKFTIGSFNYQLSKHIENKTLFVYFKNGQPVAFACWENKGKGKINISKLCAPFVELKELKAFMQKFYNCEVEMPRVLDENSQLKEVA